MPKGREEIIVGLDIGTSKVCAVVAELMPDESLDLIGIGTAESRGVSKGIVDDMSATIEAIEQSIQEAELMAGCSIRETYVNISGSHLQGVNSSGVVALKDHEVKQGDLRRVIDGARAIPLGQGREILHTLPRHFSIDDQDSITKPLGLSGVRLEAQIHMITTPQATLQNIMKCVQHSGLRAPAVVCDALASCEAVLDEDEKELGVALLDIGAGTTDVAIFVGGSLVHTAVLPIGGNHITRDISIGLRTPIPTAERIKIKYGCAKTTLVRHDETIRVNDVGGRNPKTLSRQLLADIIEPRVEELFLLVQKELRASGCEDLLASGLVLTGGCTNLDGMAEVAEEVTGLPVRRGTPQGIGGLIDVARSPAYATGIGLIQYAIQERQNPLYQAEHLQTFHWGRRWKKFRSWFGGVRRGFAEFF